MGVLAPVAAAAAAPLTGGASLIPLIAGVAGAGLSAYGAYEGGQATAANDEYRAAVARNNAIISDRNAKWAINAGETASTNEGLKTRARVGNEKASQAASGISVNSGSAADVRAGTQSLGLLDAMTIRSNAARQAYGFQVQGASDTAQAKLDESAAEQARTAGDIGAAGGLLSGVSTVGDKYAGYLAGAGGSGPTSPAAYPTVAEDQP